MKFLTASRDQLLTHRYTIPQRQRNALRLAAYSHMARDRPVLRPLDAQVRERVLAEEASRIHVGGEEVAVAR